MVLFNCLFYFTAIIINQQSSIKNIKKISVILLYRKKRSLIKQVIKKRIIHMSRQLNCGTKMKRKRQKQKKIADLLQESQPIQQKDCQKIAAQNLFNISHFQDESLKGKQLNSEADIFNSVEFHRYPSHYKKSLFNHNSTNNHSFTPSKSSTQEVSDLEKFMDNKFIQQSRQLLKLYQTQGNQNTISQATNKINFRQYKARQTEKNNDFFSNSFKSQCVFVVKRVPLKKDNTKKERKTTIKSQQSAPIKTFQSNSMTAPKQKGNKILRISPLLQTFKKQENWLSTSFQISNNENQKSNKKYSLADEYAKIQSYKTLNNTFSFKTFSHKTQNYRRAQTKIDHHSKKYIKTVLNDYSRSQTQQRDTNSFRKRLTFYKNQRSTADKKRAYLLSR